MGNVGKKIGRLDPEVLLERVLVEQGQEALQESITKAATARSGAPRVTQLKRALEAKADSDAHE